MCIPPYILLKRPHQMMHAFALYAQGFISYYIFSVVIILHLLPNLTSVSMGYLCN